MQIPSPEIHTKSLAGCNVARVQVLIVDRGNGTDCSTKDTPTRVAYKPLDTSHMQSGSSHLLHRTYLHPPFLQPIRVQPSPRARLGTHTP
jgi:hypothetical protein